MTDIRIPRKCIFLLYIVFLFQPENIRADESATLLIKGDWNYRPYEYLNSQNEPDGFNVDIINAVAREMGIKIRIELDIWSEVRSELENGEIDLLMGMFYTEERDKLVDYSIPHFIASYSIFIREGSEISTISDLQNVSVAVQKGDLAHDYIVENNLTASPVLKNSTQEALKDLAAGKVDCALVSRLQGMIILKEEKIGNIIPVGPPIIQRKYCLAVTEGNSSLLAILNEGLNIIKTTGEYDIIYDKWFGIYETPAANSKKIIRYIGVAVFPLLLIILFTFLWSWALKKRVTEKTSALMISEQELKDAQNYITNIINSMPSLLIGVDIDMKVTHWNQTAENTTGITSEMAIGKDLYDVYSDLKAETENIRESINSRKIKQHFKVPRSSDWGTVYENITIFPLFTTHRDGAVIRIDDVTEIVRMEEMMVQNEKMLSVGGLAAGMAHEINNPLAGMIQIAGVLANRLGGKIDIKANIKAAEETGISLEAIHNFMEKREIPRMISSIIDSGQRVADIVENMLSFARKGEGRFSYHSLEELIEKTLALAATDYNLKKNYDFKMIKIIKKYEETIPPVLCDGTNIQQVLLNLLQNGAQAMQMSQTKAPRFTITTEFEEKRNMARIEIEDNGPGMNENTRRRVFEPFFTTKSEGVGTGLGLSISYFIITENHGGELTIESHPGKGSKFIIRLPIDRKKVR